MFIYVIAISLRSCNCLFTHFFVEFYFSSVAEFDPKPTNDRKRAVDNEPTEKPKGSGVLDIHTNSPSAEVGESVSSIAGIT